MLRPFTQQQKKRSLWHSFLLLLLLMFGFPRDGKSDGYGGKNSMNEQIKMSWAQTNDLVRVRLALRGVKESDIHLQEDVLFISWTESSEGEPAQFQATLEESVDPESSRWEISEDSVVISMTKRDARQWNQPFKLGPALILDADQEGGSHGGVGDRVHRKTKWSSKTEAQMQESARKSSTISNKEREEKKSTSPSSFLKFLKHPGMENVHIPSQLQGQAEAQLRAMGFDPKGEKISLSDPFRLILPKSLIGNVNWHAVMLIILVVALCLTSCCSTYGFTDSVGARHGACGNERKSKRA